MCDVSECSVEVVSGMYEKERGEFPGSDAMQEKGYKAER